MEKINVFGMTPTQLEPQLVALGMKPYLAAVIVRWVVTRGVRSFDEMTNVSLAHRALLDKRFEIRPAKPIDVVTSRDGTRKVLFETSDGKQVETAVIPDGDRLTVCVSTQVGCKMGCLFCATGQQGFSGNLSAGDIISQLTQIEQAGRVTNVVYMGMGEPLDNWQRVRDSIELITAPYGLGMAARRITVSTVGLVPTMKKLLDETNVQLAVSLHSPFGAQRGALMPVEQVFAAKEVVATLKAMPLGRHRRITFEYIVFDGVNDSKRHADGLVRLINGLRCRVNLISFHPVPGVPFAGVGRPTMERFRQWLNDKGVVATIRASRGQDIDAACGLLSTKRAAAGKEGRGLKSTCE